MDRVEPTSPVTATLKERLADSIALRALGSARLERAIARACRNPALRRNLRLGAVAMAYARVLEAPEFRIAEFDDYKLWVNVAEYLGICPFFFHETGTVWPAREIVSAGDVCIDAGANVGNYTFLLGAAVGPKGRVIAFEPNPPHSATIERSLKLNNWTHVQVERRALWERSGETMRFFVSTNPTNTGTSSLVNHGLFLTADNSIDVMTVTLDAYAREAGLERLALVKIDVERAEENVLRGMTELLAGGRIDHLIVEMVAHGEAQRILVEHGYRCFFINEGDRTLVDVANIPHATFGDYLAVSPAKHDSLIRRYSDRLR